MTIYFIGGLGANRRIFQFLTFNSEIKVVYIDWLVPEKNESLRNYAKRMLASIDKSEPFILTGLSFGGMLATEMLEFVNPVKTILLSSASRRQELPFYFKLPGLSYLNKIFPIKKVNRFNFFILWLNDIKKPEEKKLMIDQLNASDPIFTKWAINEILNWRRTTTPENIIRVHGNKDKVLPIIKFRADYLIKGGGHFMVVNHAKEISKVIEEIISRV